MFKGFKRIAVTLPDVTIDCVIGGSGAPLLLLHGFPQTKALWGRIAEILAAHFSVVCMDLRGYGDSSKPKCEPDSGNYSFRAMAGDAAAVMMSLGFETFAVCGHDRGGRVGHRLALDHPAKVSRLAVLDIVPTYAMLMDTDHRLATSYWHWYFLAQPTPFPETLIAANPDYFFETCLLGWGKSNLSDFPPDHLAEYRRCWRDPATIHGMCGDYRAAIAVDLAHDSLDIAQKLQCPTLALWGADGAMAKLFDMEAEWRKRATMLTVASLPGGHFFIDQRPSETATELIKFFSERAV
jgi:haloacetate dehalogenase